MAVRVTVDRDACLSGGRCVAAAPAAFTFDDDELAVAMPAAATLGEAELSAIVAACPGQAIVVEAVD